MYQPYAPFALRNGPFLSKILLSFWEQLYFIMTGMRIMICRQTDPYGRAPVIEVTGRNVGRYYTYYGPVFCQIHVIKYLNAFLETLYR